MSNDLEQLYQAAKEAQAAKNYARASELLQQIVAADRGYKDSARMLFRATKLANRRTYNNVRLWGAIGVLLLIGLGICFLPLLQKRTAQIAPPPVSLPTETRFPRLVSSATTTVPATASPLPLPTPLPLTWSRISLGQEFERDMVSAIVIDPEDPLVLYAGMRNAGIYKSMDGGLSWQPSHLGLSNTHVQSLSVDPQTPQILYAGTMGGIFKSEDGGEHWSKIGEGTHLLLDPQDSSHLYMRDGESIYETTDQGKNWKTIYSPEESCPDKIFSWAMHPTNGKMLFLIGGGECEWGIYVSEDSGRSWSLAEKIEISPNTDIFDYGVDKLAVGLDGQGNLDIYAWETAAYDSGGSLYSYRDNHLYKINPDTKQRARLGKPVIGVGIGAVKVIAISPFDLKTIYVGGEGLSLSKDGGLTWTNINHGLGVASLQLSTGLGDDPILYIQPGECGDVDVYSQGHRLGQDNAGQPLYVSTNGGISWELSLQTGCYLLQDADKSTIYRVGKDWIWSADATHLFSWLWLSKDKGKTWQTEYITDAEPSITIVAHPLQSGALYAYSRQTFHNLGYGGEKTFISEDYGNNWKMAEPADNVLKPCYGSTVQFIDAYRPMAIDPQDGNHVFVIDNGVLLESHDSCETTNAFASSPNTSMNSIAFDPENSDTLYAGTDEGAYISFDSGQTWHQINDGLLDSTVVYSIVVDKDRDVFATTPFGIFKLEGK